MRRATSRNDVRRLLARRELVPLHPRVYVNHSGRPTRSQREWAAVLAGAPAALHRESALDAHGMTRDRPGQPREERQIHLLVDRQRRIVPPSGVTIERVRDRSTWVQDNRRPPRAQFDYALLKAAGDRSEADAIALLSDAVHQGLTTPVRLLGVIATLPRLRGRAILLEVPEVLEGERQLREVTSAAPSSATSATPPSGPWSSSTAPSGTATPWIAGSTSSETSTQGWPST